MPHKKLWETGPQTGSMAGPDYGLKDWPDNGLLIVTNQLKGLPAKVLLPLTVYEQQSNKRTAKMQDCESVHKQDRKHVL